MVASVEATYITLHLFILQVYSIFQVHINEGDVNSLAVTSVLR